MTKCKYSDEQFIEAVQSSFSIAEICRKIGIADRGGNYRVVHKKIDELGLDISHLTGKAWNQGKRYRQINSSKPLEDILTENSYYSSYHLNKRLLKEGLKEHKCERCGRTEWEGQPIPLELHHINGDNTDNRLENLQMLCPNCHALTDNFRAKNKESVKSKNTEKIINKIEPLAIELSGEDLRIHEEARILAKRRGIRIAEAEELIKNSPNKSIEDFPKRINRILEDKICPICGRIFHPKCSEQKYCSPECVSKSQSKMPSKEEFLKVIKELQGNLTKIGERFGVSSKAVTKWCIKFEIPSHKKELVQYIIDNL